MQNVDTKFNIVYNAVCTKIEEEQIGNKFLLNEYYFDPSYVLGRGSYGKVVKVINTNTFEILACKLVSRKHMEEYIKVGNSVLRSHIMIEKEIRLLSLYKHKHLISCKQVIDDKKADYIYIFLELCDESISEYNTMTNTFSNQLFLNGGSTLDEEYTAKLFKQVLKGVKYLHDMHLAHCDLKPNNIMLKDGVIKLIDLGSVLFQNEEYEASKGVDAGVGTAYFQPPEVFVDTLINYKKVDIWSLGVTFFCITMGYLPFDIAQGTFKPANYRINWESVPISPGLREFISFLLETNPQKRPDVNKCLNHPWIVNPAMYNRYLAWRHCLACLPLYKSRLWDWVFPKMYYESNARKYCKRSPSCNNFALDSGNFEQIYNNYTYCDLNIEVYHEEVFSEEYVDDHEVEYQEVTMNQLCDLAVKRKQAVARDKVYSDTCSDSLHYYFRQMENNKLANRDELTYLIKYQYNKNIKTDSDDQFTRIRNELKYSHCQNLSTELTFND